MNCELRKPKFQAEIYSNKYRYPISFVHLSHLFPLYGLTSPTKKFSDAKKCFLVMVTKHFFFLRQDFFSCSKKKFLLGEKKSCGIKNNLAASKKTSCGKKKKCFVTIKKPFSWHAGNHFFVGHQNLFFLLTQQVPVPLLRLQVSLHRVNLFNRDPFPLNSICDHIRSVTFGGSKKTD